MDLDGPVYLVSLVRESKLTFVTFYDAGTGVVYYK
jgi:hypothetical protein